MTLDTRGITKEMENKRLRVNFADGETAEVKLVWVMLHDCHEDCNGFIYDLISTDRTEKYTSSSRQAAMWGDFENVAAIELLGD